MVTLINVL